MNEINFLSKPPSRKTVIWDLGETLIGTNQFGLAREIGLKDFLLYSLIDWQNPRRIKETVFELLTELEPSEGNFQAATYANDDILPASLCNWLKGRKSGSEIYDEAHSLIDYYEKLGFFINSRQTRLIKQSLKIMFDPDMLAKHTYCIKPALELVEKCAQSQNKLLILSNYDVPSFNRFAQTSEGQTVLKYFKPEDIIISGKIGLIKPNPAIYKFVLNRYNLNAQDCVFIDDQYSNIESAQKCGIISLQLKNQNYKKIEEQLRELAIF